MADNKDLAKKMQYLLWTTAPSAAHTVFVRIAALRSQFATNKSAFAS
jgi:hypothetical protein